VLALLGLIVVAAMDAAPPEFRKYAPLALVVSSLLDIVGRDEDHRARSERGGARKSSVLRGDWPVPLYSLD